jgi:exodeoxyribonuclease VII small subunit
MAKKKEVSFEEALANLENLVEKLEDTNLPLEEAINCFEDAMKMSSLCSNKLNEAERKITILTTSKELGKDVEEKFSMEGTDDYNGEYQDK